MTVLGITCMRDDGPYCAEWIAHHLVAGFDQILLLSHDCSDGSDRLLEALAQDPRVLHVPFTPKGRKSVQWQALTHVAKHPAYLSCDWALFFDVDEFLCLPEGRSLPEQITEFEAQTGAFDALALPWRLFGSGGHTRWGNGITPARFRMAAPADVHFPLAHLFKTLHRPGAFQKPGVHRPRAKPKKPARWIGPDGQDLPEGFALMDAAITLYGLVQNAPEIWLNHYSLRSTEEFMIKRARGLPNHMDREIGVTYWAERNWNSVQCTEIDWMLPATQTMLKQLFALPEVRAAQQGVLAAHKSRFAGIMADLEELRLHFRLGLLTGSTPPSEKEGRAFVQAQIQLQARLQEQMHDKTETPDQASGHLSGGNE